MISPASIQLIVSRLDVLDVVGNYVKLKKRGANYLGLCPFHNEKTPSFTVSPAKEIFKCFGCGKSGNSISFLMEHDKLSYVEALRWLANRYNIEIEETNTSPEKREQFQVVESLHIINAFAQTFYSQQLFKTESGNNIALSYLKKRGFKEEILKKFGIGYAPNTKDAFTARALSAQYNQEILVKSGLVVQREGLADNYRDRIIFPVHSNNGKLIGFGARLIKTNDKAPKYINTPENEVYVKSKILYGTYFARQAIDKANECLLVEGYTDVLSLHQAGIENVVASGGTSLTGDQLRLIKKYTNNLTIIYDGDAAGVKAALRGLDMALEESLNVKLVLIPDGEDPDSYLQKIGAAAFKDFVAQNKKDFVLFKVDVSLKEAANDASKKSEVVNDIAETIAKIDKAEDFTKQQDYIRQCSQLLNIDESGFTALVNKFIRNRISTVENKLPFEEAKVHEENAKKAAVTEYDDQTYSLLFKDDLQEREVARILLEYGNKQWNSSQLIAEYVLSELPEEDVIENEAVLKLIQEIKHLLQEHLPIDKNIFLYNQDGALSTLAVSLLHFPYEQSIRWKTKLSDSSGYQQNLFQQDYTDFIKTLSRGNEEKLMSYLKMEEDKTFYEIESAITYLKLRKIRKLLMQNQIDMEKAQLSNSDTLFRTHLLLKQMEIELTKKLGSVIIK